MLVEKRPRDAPPSSARCWTPPSGTASWSRSGSTTAFTRPSRRPARSSTRARSGAALHPARYGHGGGPGYDREWRADPEIAGGGELLDQGVHLIDLARWFCGDFTEVAGHVATYYECPVEDNGFALLKTADGRVAWLHASCTEWKNLFSFEIFGRVGKLQIDGLGGSYGAERLTFYRMLPEMGPPGPPPGSTRARTAPGTSRSTTGQTCIETGRQPCGTVSDALAALTIVERLYEGPGAVIITRSPLRITLGGGGTDLPSTSSWRLPDQRRDRQVRLHHDSRRSWTT